MKMSGCEKEKRRRREMVITLRRHRARGGKETIPNLRAV